MSYFFYGPAPDGRRFCWAKAPTHACRARAQIDDPAAPRVLEIAALLDVRADWLTARLRGAHDRVRDDEGRWTERCLCGSRMDRLGFRCWVERPVDDATAERVASRLGFEPPMVVVRATYARTKREAKEWALEELRLARAAG